jgi:hypothetical protein
LGSAAAPELDAVLYPSEPLGRLGMPLASFPAKPHPETRSDSRFWPEPAKRRRGEFTSGGQPPPDCLLTRTVHQDRSICNQCTRLDHTYPFTPSRPI